MAFAAALEVSGQTATITLSGELDAAVAGQLKELVEQAAAGQPRRLVLHLPELEYMASAGLRILIFTKQKLGTEVSIFMVGCQAPILSTLRMSGFAESVYLLGSLGELPAV